MEKIEVYHAGTDRIESPDCLRGRRNLDFGRGFYIGIFSKWRKIEVVKWAEDAIYASIQTTDDKNCSLR